MGQQQHRVRHRLDSTAAQLVVAGVAVPAGVELLLHAVGEREVGGGVVVGCQGRFWYSEEQGRDESGQEHAGQGGPFLGSDPDLPGGAACRLRAKGGSEHPVGGLRLHPLVAHTPPAPAVTLRHVPDSPLDAHVATPQDLKERIAAERRGTPFLVYRDADNLQVIVELAPTAEQLTVGRRPSNDVVLDWDSEISRVHAALERIGEDWTVIDDGLSHNGTYLNGSRVTSRQRLKDGDVLTVGGVALAFRAPGGESMSRPTVTAMGPHLGELLTPAQRRVLIALCRPFRTPRTRRPRPISRSRTSWSCPWTR